MSRRGSRTRAGAGAAVLVVLAASPAGAVETAGSVGSAPGALSPGCERSGGGHVTCTYTTPTTSPLRVDVPDGVRRAVISVRGGAGGPGAVQTPLPVAGLRESPGGPGGTAVAAVALDPRQDLDVRVGGAAQSGIEGGGGGAGGGGNGNTLIFLSLGLAGGGGGGGSEVRTTGSNPRGTDPLIAAGGGGGGGSGLLGPDGPSELQLGPGGAGGGTAGASAPALGAETFGSGGAGGTSSAGGNGGGLLVPGLPPVMGGSGVRGQGGDAGMLTIPKMFEDGTGGGGGGGGGYYGGAAGSLFAGGGGGSGFGPPDTRYGIADGAADGARDGAVVIVFDAPTGDGAAGTTASHRGVESQAAVRVRR